MMIIFSKTKNLSQILTQTLTFMKLKTKRICAIQLKLRQKSEEAFQNLDSIKFKNLHN